MELYLQNSVVLKPRREIRNGREYLVAPLTMIVPGVLPGSRGRLYYPPEEIARNVDAWNDIPMVVYHPVVNGQQTTGRNPKVLDYSKVGRVYNARIGDGGKLQADGWFDVEACRRVDVRILHSLDAGVPIELSTGLFTRNQPTAGTFNGSLYDGVARDYRPDHLAILPDKRGACSLKDGCGVLVNEAGVSWKPPVVSTYLNNSRDTSDMDDLMNGGDAGLSLLSDNIDLTNLGSLIAATFNAVRHEPKTGRFMVANATGQALNAASDQLDMTPDKACKILKDGTVRGHPLTEAQKGMFGALCGKRDRATHNAKVPDDMSLDELQSKVWSAFKESHPDEYDPRTGRLVKMCMIVAVYPDRVVYREMNYAQTYNLALNCGGMDHADMAMPMGKDMGELYAVGYTIDGDGNVAFDEVPSSVKKVTTFEPTGNSSDCGCGCGGRCKDTRNAHDTRDDSGKFDTDINAAMRRAIKAGFGPKPNPQDRSDGPQDRAAQAAHSPAAVFGEAVVNHFDGLPFGRAHGEARHALALSGTQILTLFGDR